MTVVTSQPPQPIHRSALGYALADAKVMTKRHVIHTIRIPDLLVGSTIQPIMFVLLFRYVFGGEIHVPGYTYVNFLMAGIFVQTVMFGSLATGIGLAADLDKGVIDRFRSLPMSPSAVLTGKTIADMMRNTLTIVVMLIVGVLVGFRPLGNPLNWVGAILLMMAFGYTMSWISAIVGTVCKTVEATQQLSFIAVFPLTFAASTFVPTANMPGWLQAFANNQPVTHVIDASRALLNDKPVGNHLLLSVMWTVGLLVVFVPLAVRLYQRSASR